MEIVFVALEKGVFRDLQEDVEIAARTAVGAGLPFAAETQTIAIGYAWRGC